ncbi:MAG: acyl transferase [Bacteroidetes bacterium]|nr:acyl transferase [Bacteroidota bacterium]
MKSLFLIHNEADFKNACLETFNHQYQTVNVYQDFVNYLKIRPQDVLEIQQIPFLPIELFKKHQILSQNSKADHYFQSSGTTQMLNRSRHWIAEFALYEESIYHSFSRFIGPPEEYIYLGLLPNYSENKHSSLIYMVDFLMRQSKKSENGYFLYNHQDLLSLLQKLKNSGKKVILFGVSFALLDFLDYCKSVQQRLDFPELIVIETGGMKGRKQEMTKDELLVILKNEMGTQNIYSEYSMTELLSQAYSLGDNLYQCPAWMRVMIRNVEDPFSYVADGKTGAINIIDLANRYSCSFIATQDLGKIQNGFFQVLGRIDHSDIRGCSLLVS